MKKIKVYDWPTRLFHWQFALLFFAAFIIAKTIDDDSPLYAYHKIFGLILAFIVFLRIIWGIFGSRYAKFVSFELHPMKLIIYFRNIFSKNAPVSIAHNPASSWAALLMLFLSLGLVTTGVLMSKNINKEVVEEIHEIFANIFIITVIAHILGVAFHTIKHRDGIALSMVHGKKNGHEIEKAISNTYPKLGIFFLALVALFASYLNFNYNTNTGSLKLFMWDLQIGEEKGSVDSE